MELINPLFLFSFILFMTPTSHSICVARLHNSTTASPPPPPRKTTPTVSSAPSTSSETTSFHATPGNPQVDVHGDGLFSRSTIPVNPRLKRLCFQTDYPSLCLSSLSPFLAGKSFSITSALAAAIKAASQHAKQAAATAAKLAASREANEDDKEAIGTCKDSYEDALDNLQQAAEAVPSQDIGTVNSMLSAVVTDSENCGDATEGTEAGTKLSKYDDKLRKLASNGLAIASLIN
ncbi:Pectinesterase inhibitor [Morus notabilis]|uniref:Pectinesterase inhibitor n=1 Tax=Morus notabilis TaxID=981085 RepID=W9RG03_9ROSA|nr:pectinesterase inhibitor [Morus notabilis]EXB71065.1 Pectinesterase inhibitor [Morus notabilis]